MAQIFEWDNFSKNAVISSTDVFRGNDRTKARKQRQAWKKVNERKNKIYERALAAKENR